MHRLAAALVVLGALVGCGQADPVESSAHDLTQKHKTKGCATADDCGAGQYCAFSDGVCGDGEVGICKTPADTCEQIDDPVCGCDGQTYANGCEAGRAGASVAYDGSCVETTNTTPSGGEEPPPTGACGGVDCGGGQYCDWADGSCGDNQGAGGVCKDPAGPCTGKYEPVCGCDGQTYETKCAAMVSGVSVRHEGGC